MSDQPKVQNRNADLIDLLSTDFVKRNEPNYAWRAACSAILALPALRAFWPMSSVDYAVASRARDVAGGAYHLSDNNTVTFGYDQLAPYAEFDGVNQYLSRADGGAANWADILGTEAYIVSTQRGLTLGGWFNFDDPVGSGTEILISKDANALPNRAYTLQRINTGAVRFLVSTGAANTSVDSTTITTDTGGWYFVAGRFQPSVAIDVFVNGAQDTNAVGVPAALADIGTAFAIAARGTATAFLNGRASLCFLCAATLSDSIITALYHNTRKMYGV